MLYDQIILAKNGDQSAMLVLIEKFMPLIKKYSNQLNTEDSFEELRLKFVELIMSLNLDTLRIRSDGAIVAYIAKSIKTQYIAQNKHYKAKLDTIFLEDLDESIKKKYEPNSSLFSTEQEFYQTIPVETLNEKELAVIVGIYLYGYSSAEIARAWNLTRQAINQIKLRALKKIQDSMI